MSLPQVNATLERVSQEGAAEAEAYDGPPDEPDNVEVWSGSAEAYFRERRDRVRTAEGEDRVIVRELIVQTGEPAIAWRSSHVVRFTVDDEERTGKVRLVERRALEGIPAGLQTTRLTLEDA